ncbi:hypothetical protein MASR1M32_16780 [Rhodobacter sp.]
MLLEIVEERMAVPQRIREAAVLRAGIGRGLEFALGQHLLRFDVVLQRLAPVADLMLQHLGRILHHLGQIGRRSLYVDVRRGAAEGRIGLPAMR